MNKSFILTDSSFAITRPLCPVTTSAWGMRSRPGAWPVRWLRQWGAPGTTHSACVQSSPPPSPPSTFVSPALCKRRTGPRSPLPQTVERLDRDSHPSWWSLPRWLCTAGQGGMSPDNYRTLQDQESRTGSLDFSRISANISVRKIYS